MKKIVAGIGFEITGMLMVICSTALTSMNMEKTTAWATHLGRYWQTVFDLGLLPAYIMGSILLLTGIAFSLWGVFSKSDK